MTKNRTGIKVFLFLIAIMLCISSVIAYSPSYLYVNTTNWNYLLPSTHNTTATTAIIDFPTSVAECNGFCSAVGCGASQSGFRMIEGTSETTIGTSYNYGYSSSRTGYPSDATSGLYLKRYLIFACRCEAQPYDGGLYKELAAKVYFWPTETLPLTASFTAIPSSGNASLNVNFTPKIYGGTGGLNRVVWDYDGGLGSETKTEGMNTTFNKTYPTAGRFTTSLVAYDGAGNTVSASQKINVYNYSQGITPTPTLTPTPTPTGQSNTTGYIKIKGYDALNLTDIAGLSIGMLDVDDVASGWFNVTANNGTYTYNGYGTGGNKPFVMNHRYMFSLSKTGYVTYTTQGLTYQGGSTGGIAYDFPLTPTAYVPVSSNFVLAISLLNQGQPVKDDLVGTVKIFNQSSSWTATVTNPENGYINFAGLTPSASYKIEVNLEGYENYVGYFASSSAMGGTTQYYYANLESTNQLPSTFTLTVTPQTGTVNDTYTVKIDGDLSSATKVTIRTSSETKGPMFMLSGNYYTQYSKVGGTWKQWDGSSYSVTASPTGNILAKIQNPYPYDDVYTVTAYITINGNVYDCSDTINIVAQGTEYVQIVAYDTGTGGMDARMSEFSVYIHDLYTDLWINKTYTYQNFLTENTLTTTPGAALYYYGTALGYKDTTPKTLYVKEGQTNSIQLMFYPSSLEPPSADNVTLFASVTNNGGIPLMGASVHFSDGQICLTKATGRCSVTALNNTFYSAYATHSAGYTSGSASITTNKATTNEIKLVLATMTLTPTGVIPTWTKQPTANISTPATPKTWDDTTAYTCGQNSSTWMGWFKSNLACNGCETAMCQSFVIVALIFMFFMGFGGRYGKGIGAGIGAIVALAVCLAMALIPFWFVAVVIVILLLFIGIILFKSA